MMTKLEGTLKYVKTSLVLPRGSNLGLIQSLDSAANWKEIFKKRKKEDHVELQQEYEISKMQTMGNSTG